MKAGTLSNTLAKVKAKELGDALAATLAEVEVETLSSTLVDLKAVALVDALAHTLARWRPRK